MDSARRLPGIAAISVRGVRQKSGIGSVSGMVQEYFGDTCQVANGGRVRQVSAAYRPENHTHHDEEHDIGEGANVAHLADLAVRRKRET